MNILRRFFVRPARPEAANSDRAAAVIEELLDGGTVALGAVEHLANLADVEAATVETEVLTAEEFRNRYRPRITYVPPQQPAILATIDL